jgi:hypothetical protein
VPLVANSTWTRDIVRERYGDQASIEVIHLGIDHHMLAHVAEGPILLKKSASKSK